MQIIVGLLVVILSCVLALLSHRPTPIKASWTGAAWSRVYSSRLALSHWTKNLVAHASKSIAALSIVASGYAYIYSLANEAYQRGETNASLRLTSFITLISGQRPAFVAAMNDFAAVQNSPSYEAPSFWRVGTWYRPNHPNRRFLSNWAISFFAQCEASTCGHDKFRIDLRSARLRAADLMLVDLDDADLGYASAADVMLDAASLRNSRLRSAHLINAGIRGTNFTGAKLQCADLRGAKADILSEDDDYTQFVDADLRGVDARDATFDATVFDNANLGRFDCYTVQRARGRAPDDDSVGELRTSTSGRSSNFANVSAKFAKFRGANLNDIDFRNANLSGADFSGADLTNANLSGTRLDDAEYTAGTIWPKGFNPAEAGATLVENRAP